MKVEFVEERVVVEESQVGPSLPCQASQSQTFEESQIY